MRLFIAIDLPATWKVALVEVERSIGWLGRGVKWVQPAGVHLTLRFLGDVDEKDVEALKSAIAEACVGIAPFSIRMIGTGVFPNARRPRVFWVGVEAPPSLFELQTRIERAVDGLGFAREDQAFKPHLTVARIKDSIGKERITEALLDYRIESPLHDVSEVRLMQSHLASTGASYEALAVVSLDSNTTATPLNR